VNSRPILWTDLLAKRDGIFCREVPYAIWAVSQHASTSSEQNPLAMLALFPVAPSQMSAAAVPL
jgi:hypothetical protein